MSPKLSEEERFWKKVRKEPNGCWIWTAAKSKRDGYGLCHYPRTKTDLAHRVAYRLKKGPIPKRQVVHHTCHNRACVNPEHLEAGTQRKNILEAKDAGHLGRVRGEDSHAHVLTENQVHEILAKWEMESERVRREGGRRRVGYGKLAKVYNVGRSAIRKVVVRETWKHVDVSPEKGKTENH